MCTEPAGIEHVPHAKPRAMSSVRKQKGMPGTVLLVPRSALQPAAMEDAPVKWYSDQAGRPISCTQGLICGREWNLAMSFTIFCCPTSDPRASPLGRNGTLDYHASDLSSQEAIRVQAPHKCRGRPTETKTYDRRSDDPSGTVGVMQLQPAGGDRLVAACVVHRAS